MSKSRNRLSLALVVMTVGAVIAALATPVGAQAASGTIVGVASSRCVDVPGAKSANGTQIELWDCNGGANQQVTVTSSGQLQIGGKCLEPLAAARTAGTSVVIGACTDGTSTQWAVNAAGPITAVVSGLCLDATDRGTANGTLLELWTCNSGTNQNWKVSTGSTTPPTTTPPATPPTTPPVTTSPPPSGFAKPPLGWSSWSFVRDNPTAKTIEAMADAMKSSGLAAVGYQYVNIDDAWYVCPANVGPSVDANGRWLTDSSKFPDVGSTPGIKAAADHVHADGLKFGLYVTPGISEVAVSKNTPIAGTTYHAKDIATTATEKNYNCKHMVGIDYSKPGAQAFINSWADQFASWGVDYVKMDGIGTSDVADLKAWRTALNQSGRSIHLELSNQLAIGSAATWRQYSDGWRTGNDVEKYNGSGAIYPLTQWSGKVAVRFQQVADWAPYGGNGHYNDYDSVEVGNGSNTGLTAPERQSMLSLWSLAASPLILGTDLTNLDATDLGYLKNTRVLAVDQDGIDAKRIVSSGDQQVYSKTEANGDIIVGLFNSSATATTTVSVALSAAGLKGSGTATDLWTGSSLGNVSGTYSVSLNDGAVRLLRIVPAA